jgi:serine/threonine-protein kinase
MTELCAKIVADPPTPLREIDPTLPASLEAAVQRCLEKDVSRRPASVAELAVVMRPFASAEWKLAVDRIARIDAAASSPSGGSLATPSGDVASRDGRQQMETAWRVAPGRRVAIYVATGVAGIFVAGIVVVALRSIHPGASKATALVPPPRTSAQAPVPAVPVIPAPAATADVGWAVASASAVASSTSVASAPAKTPATAAKRAPKPAANQAPAVDLLLDRK